MRLLSIMKASSILYITCNITYPKTTHGSLSRPSRGDKVETAIETRNSEVVHQHRPEIATRAKRIHFSRMPQLLAPSR